jgi:uncharacterized membrane protein YdjX (TVP38/TMEM64 family)
MPSTEPLAMAATSSRPRLGRWAFGLLVAGGLVAAATLLPLDRWLLDLVEWIRGAGGAGVAVFALVYGLATVLLLPGSLLTLGAGFAYGPIAGTLLVSPVSVVAATAAFLLGRSVARGWIARRVEGSPRFRAIDEAVGTGGFRIVLLLRLSPVFPFNVLNYALGLTRVRVRDYVLASFLGMLPGTFMYVYLGSLVTSAAELASGEAPDAGPWRQAMFYGGLLATVVVTVLITRTARRALDRSLRATGKGAP